MPQSWNKKTQYHSEAQEPLCSDTLCISVIAFGTFDIMLVEDKEFEYSWKGKSHCVHHIV